MIAVIPGLTSTVLVVRTPQERQPMHLKPGCTNTGKTPYPTKGEKIMLAIITRMTLTQVSTWFANARRRLKKENKIDGKDGDILDLDDIDVDGKK